MAGPMAIPEPSSELLVRMLEWSIGRTGTSRIRRDDRFSDRNSGLLFSVIARNSRSFEVLIIGAGIAGICAAFYLPACWHSLHDRGEGF